MLWYLIVGALYVNSCLGEKWVWSSNHREQRRGFSDRQDDEISAKFQLPAFLNRNRREREPTTVRPHLNKPQADYIDPDDPRINNPNYYNQGGLSNLIPNAQNGILVGPGGPTGYIGRPGGNSLGAQLASPNSAYLGNNNPLKGNAANGILVGPGGPTGIIGRPPYGTQNIGGGYGGYPGQGGFPGQGFPNGNSPNGFFGQGGYPGQQGFNGQPGIISQPGFGGQQGFGNPQGFPGQQPFPGQQGFSGPGNQPGFPTQAGFPGGYPQGNFPGGQPFVGGFPGQQGGINPYQSGFGLFNGNIGQGITPYNNGYATSFDDYDEGKSATTNKKKKAEGKSLQINLGTKNVSKKKPINDKIH